MTTCHTLPVRLQAAIHREVSCCLRFPAARERRDPVQDVADLTHDVVVTLLASDARELRRWDPRRGRSLESFVRLVARRSVARSLGQRRRNPWADRPTAPSELDGADGATEQRRLEHRDRLRRVLQLLQQRMNARDRELFHRVFVEEADRDEVADALHMTRGALDAWCYRTRRLAAMIASELDGPRTQR